MGYEPGGRSDKLGNRYEGRWVAKQLLRLLKEEIRSITIEPIGDEEFGVDLWVETNSGLKEAHQCKARYKSQEYWSISDLKFRGVLKYLKSQLDRIPDCEYLLVSGIPFTTLGDICDSARNSNNDAEAFYTYQVKDIGHSRLQVFREFCIAMDLSVDEPDDRRKAYDYLRRTRIILFPDDNNSREDLRTWTGFLLTGTPDTVIAILLKYAEENDRFGIPIYPDDLFGYLKTQEIYPKNLASDSRILPVIERLRSEFEESISPALINKTLIHRKETDSCLEALMSSGIVILHGAAGSGKSAMLFELTQTLREKNIPYLQLRLDRRVPDNTAFHYGESIGLPDSPVHCLTAISGNRQCVLILDQLDAVRWTSAHSATALDVCREMVSQVVLYRREGKKISVVLSCRTFDLAHDPEIRNWLSDNINKNKKIEILPLPQSIVSEIVGKEFATMSERQRNILANPQNLALWIELCKSKCLSSFRSSTELMKQFWQYIRRQIEILGIDVNEINAVLGCLVDWLEKQGKISAPDRIISSRSAKAIDTLKSNGIIQEQNGRICFCHQSYLDFLIAERLINEIYSGGTILEWLGAREKQTLFRRQQLRQALTLLSDEEPTKFFEAVRQILILKETRFHIKNLVLELIGQLEEIPEEVAEFCLELIHDDYWKPHIFGTVFYGNVPFIQLLINQGIICKWLNSGSEEMIKRSLALLQSCANRIPDQVAEQLTPFIGKGKQWLIEIHNTIGRQVVYDSEVMFELRLNIIRSGIISDYIDWEALCGKYPIRTLKLIEAIMSTWDIDKEGVLSTKEETKFEFWDRTNLHELSIVAENYPEKTWELFIPHIVRLTSFKASPYDEKLNIWKKKVAYVNIRSAMDLARDVVELSIIAGRILAVDKPDILIKWTQSLESSESDIIQEIIMESYPYLPGKYADVGINWLLADVSRFRFGDKLGSIVEPEWKPAARLIEALSPNCSDELFLKLEQYILHYHEPDEKGLAQYCLKTWKKGSFDHFWGHAQYFLLPALAPHRIKKSSIDMISVLKRKFVGYSDRRVPFTAVEIVSKLERNLERISNLAWLNIISNKKIQEEGRGNWIQVSEGEVAVSSIRQFSRSLGAIARRYPERFGRLALKFSETTNHKYISAIFNAMAQTKPISELSGNECDVWEPASIDTVLAVLEKFFDISDRETAMSFCRLMESRAIEEWPDRAIQKILYLAAHHPHPEPGKLVLHCDKNSEEVVPGILFQNTLNCVRGVAAKAIGELLWHHPNWYEKLRPGIEVIITDPHPVVRMAAIATLLPVLNIDKMQAVQWFYEISKRDQRVLVSPYAIEFFNYTIREFHNQLRPLVLKMIDSSCPDVSQHGAELVTSYYLFYGFFADELALCDGGPTPQRMGVAKIATAFINDEKYAEQCRKLLNPLFDDPDKEVRNKTVFIFKDNFLNSPENISLAIQFVHSKAFIENVRRIIHYLKDFKESLIPCDEIILEICKVMIINLNDTSNDFLSLGWYEISSLLLRLYEQSLESNLEVANCCLDIWDDFFEKGMGLTRELTKSIEN